MTGPKRPTKRAHPAADVAVNKPRTSASAGESAQGTPEPPSRLRLPLRTLDDVKAELARLYREGKSRRRDVADVSRLAHVLGILGRLIESADLEQRIAELEAANGKKP